MNNISLGRYIPNDTFVHRLDPRVKLLAFIMGLVVVLIGYGSTQQNFLMYGIFFALLLVVMIVGKISFLKVLKSLKALWFMMIFLLVINTLLTTSGNKAFEINGFVVYWDGIIKTLYIIVRLMMMIMLTTILTASTKPLELTFALEWLLTPLKWIKVPVHVFAMTLSLSLRFIPTLAEEANKIMRAQAARGVDFKEGKLKDRFKGLVSLIVPLFLSCFMCSGDLADAMDARGYNPLAKRTKYRRRHWDTNNTIWTIFLILFLGGCITLAVLQPDFIQMIQGAING